MRSAWPDTRTQKRPAFTTGATMTSASEKSSGSEFERLIFVGYMNPDPLNSINLLSSFVTLMSGAAAVWLWANNKLRTTASLAERLKDDIARRDTEISKLESQ